jgi:MFS superfamily sulfate permease-like transporter
LSAAGGRSIDAARALPAVPALVAARRSPHDARRPDRRAGRRDPRVAVGFSAGAAIWIAASQIKSFFGITIAAESSFLETLYQFARQVPNINPWVTATGLFTLGFGIFARKYIPKIPFMISATIVALFAATSKISSNDAKIDSVHRFPGDLSCGQR